MTGTCSTLGLTVPDTRDTVLRQRLLGPFERATFSAVVLSAPAAYGKSVLAAQMASCWSGGPSLWASIPEGCVSAVEVVASVLERLTPGAVGTARRGAGVSAAPAFADLVDALNDLLRSQVGQGICLVLDNLKPDAVSALDALATLPTAPESAIGRVVMTIRLPPGADLPMGAWWSVGPDDLLLDDCEARAIVEPLLGIADASEIGAVLGASGHQAGLLSVLVKCVEAQPASLRRISTPHPQIRVLLRGLAESQLEPRQLMVLQQMAFLGEGMVDDLREAQRSRLSADLAAVTAALPLVRVENPTGRASFRVHEIAQTTFSSPQGLWEDSPVVFRALAEVLERRGDHTRLLNVVVDVADPDTVREFARRVGRGLLEVGARGTLERVFTRVSAADLVGDPALLVLKAIVDLTSGRADDARRSAQAALDVARHEGDSGVAVDALVTLSQVESGLGDFVRARAYADQAAVLCDRRGDAGLAAALCGRRMAMSALLGDWLSFAEQKSEAVALLDHAELGDSSSASLRFFVATGLVALCGSWSEALPLLETACRCSGLDFAARASALYNLCGALLQMGRTDRAADALNELRALAARGSGLPIDNTRCLAAGIKATSGDTGGLVAETTDSSTELWSAGDRLNSVTGSMFGALAMLGNRQPEDALTAADRAVSLSRELGAAALEWPAQLERAASLLFLGDYRQAERLAQHVHDVVAASGQTGVHLKSDAVLAALDCQNNAVDSASSRFREHADYIASESANWQLAMYVRAFPSLMGPLAVATGVSELPVHMLRMIPPQYHAEIVAAARAALSPPQLALLSHRLSGRSLPCSELASPQQCRVRLFGGLHVEVDGRVVRDSEWRKRKARLLFAMLASRCGKDVPRDQLLEYLWPEMDGEQALNNLYVVWSAMKHALMPGAKRGDACPYVEHRGGVCRAVLGHVLTDLDEFDEQLAVAARARQAGDSAAESAALQRVAEIYTGELLPGEAYDDWFSAARERCRHDFEDAMLRAASLLESAGDAQGGVGLLRRALQHDPWREDLYQAALRLQILSGQRSAAIETYLTCRTRLVDDLGIDPSSETTGLYQHVLGMEDAADHQAPGIT